MEKKQSDKPWMRVYKMRQRSKLLVDSGSPQGGAKNYNWNNLDEE